MVQSQTGQPMFYAVPVRQAASGTGPAGPPPVNGAHQLVQTASGPVLVQQTSLAACTTSSAQKPQLLKAITTAPGVSPVYTTTTAAGEHLVCTCPPELHQSEQGLLIPRAAGKLTQIYDD
ncbi:hypothetical protein Ciccas_009148 [Cichlidogyrus casuarinus]|uniref:Uncharacterized protein n=1 Tax=Cichlidogyrus casuarinus TaxID=1844966 RepID=A0ABD2Q2A9_9PLAT